MKNTPRILISRISSPLLIAKAPARPGSDQQSLNEIDFAIVYWGLTRSTKYVYNTHIQYIFNVLDQHNLSYKKFMHTWKTADNIQYVWDKKSSEPIDYTEYNLLTPDIYRIDNQDDFLKGINMDDYYYKDSKSEWLPGLIKNHICALESMKRAIKLVGDDITSGIKFKYIMFVRPDVKFSMELPIDNIISNQDKIIIPDFDHGEGYNDRFAIMNYNNACIYANRLDSLSDFRKTNGRIVSEKYLKYIIKKNNLDIYFINFKFVRVRPSKEIR